LIIYQKQNFGREIDQVYTFSDLRRRRFLAETDMVALAGEDQMSTVTADTGSFP
jgi:hypothetical protein